MTNAKDNTMVFNIGETVQVWDWIAAHNGKDPDVLEAHGAIGVIARHSSANDVHRGNRLGKRAGQCFHVAIPNRGLIHINQEWLRKVG